MGAGVVAGGLCDCRGVGRLLFFWRRFYVYIFILSMLSAGVFLDAFRIGFCFSVCEEGIHMIPGRLHSLIAFSLGLHNSLSSIL
jgi:hypothetical protein